MKISWNFPVYLTQLTPYIFNPPPSSFLSGIFLLSLFLQNLLQVADFFSFGIIGLPLALKKPTK